MYGESKSMNSTTEPCRHYQSVESISSRFSRLFFLPSFSHMLLCLGAIYYEDEIQHLTGAVFLPLKISSSSQVKPKLYVTCLWISSIMDMFSLQYAWLCVDKDLQIIWSLQKSSVAVILFQACESRTWNFFLGEGYPAAIVFLCLSQFSHLWNSNNTCCVIGRSTSLLSMIPKH